MNKEKLKKLSDEDLCDKYLHVQGEGTFEDYCKLDDELKKRLSSKSVEEYKKGLVEEIEKINISDYSNECNNFELGEDDITNVVLRIKDLINNLK